MKNINIRIDAKKKRAFDLALAKASSEGFNINQTDVVTIAVMRFINAVNEGGLAEWLANTATSRQ